MRTRNNNAESSWYKRLFAAESSVGARELVVLRGKRGGTVYGCRKILQYSPIEIRLLLSGCAVSLVGESLYCTSFGAGTVTVEGEIRSATYLPKTLE